MKASHSLLSFSLLALMLLPGCLRAPKYTPRPLTKLTKETADFSQTQDNVTVMAKKLPPGQSYDAIGTNLLKEQKSIETIQLTVENNNTENIHLKSMNINLPLISTQKITKHVSHGIAAPLAGYGLLTASSVGLGTAGFFTTVFGCNPFGGLYLPLVVPGCGLMLGAAALFVIAPTIGIIKAVKTANVNKIIKADVEAKTLSTLVVQPNETKNTLIFVRTKDLPNEFSLKVGHEADANKTIDFAISLNPKLQSEPLVYKS